MTKPTPQTLPADDYGTVPLQELPSVLLPYQRELYAALETDELVISEKSRRIGATWGVGAWSTLKAARARSAGGSDVFYIGYNLEMTREYIDTCASWSRSFGQAASSVGEFLFEDAEKDGDSKHIKAFRIDYDSGFSIVALASRPRSLRGMQGAVLLDEAAFHDDLGELLKAALALLIWGGQVLVISTHNGVDNAFNELLSEVRSGKRPATIVRTTFKDAIAAGLYRRVCLKAGKPWTAEGEVEWEAKIRAFYGDAATEELDCVPRQSGGRYLPRTLLEARAVDVPVLRWSCPDDFVDRAEDERILACEEWFGEHVRPLLDLLAGGASFVGVDFGRSGDLSVMWPVTVDQLLQRRTPFVVELRNVPFKQQEQVLFALCDGLPNFRGAALDARGNGQYLAEVTRQQYGAECVAEVMLSEGWYREHMPPFKAALEDARFDVPRDAEVIDDLRQLEVARGVARVAETRTKGATGNRHGDAAIAAALVMYASSHLDAGPSHVALAGGGRVAQGAFAGHEELHHDLKGWV